MPQICRKLKTFFFYGTECSFVVMIDLETSILACFYEKFCSYNLDFLMSSFKMSKLSSSKLVFYFR